MEKFRSLFSKWDSDKVKFLASLGITADTDDSSWVDIPYEQYLEHKDLIDEWDASAATKPEFTKTELRNAEFLAQTNFVAKGYPKPEDDYRDLVFDSFLCKVCRIPKNQVAPFRIKTDKLRVDSFSLIWEYDALFVRRFLFENVFRDLGFTCRPVIIHSTGKESTEFVQLNFEHPRAPVNTEGLRFEICSRCNSKKYIAQFEDFLPGFSERPEFGLVQSSEYFGSGGLAYRLTIYSSEFRDLFVKEKLAKPWMFYPFVDSKSKDSD